MKMAPTLSPLPDWMDIFRVLWKRNIRFWTDLNLEGYYLAKAFWLSRSYWSIYLIAEWRVYFVGRQDLVIWIPEYFCDETIFQLRKKGYKLFFYPLSEDLNPKYELFQELATQIPPDIFIATHFFGEIFELDLAVDFCKRSGAWLIEDAAHVIFPNNEVGKLSDFTIYSLHKHFPIPDGALLMVNNGGPSKISKIITNIDDEHKNYELLVNSPGSNNWAAWLWLVKQVVKKIGFRANYSTPSFDAFSPIKESLPRIHPRLSAIAKKMIAQTIFPCDKVHGIRISNEKKWIQVMEWASPSNFLRPIITHGTPFFGRFMGESLPHVRELFNKLCRIGIVTAAWPNLPDEVLRQPENHFVPLKLRHTRLFLPIHQTLTEKEIVIAGNHLLEMELEGWSCTSIGNREWEDLYSTCVSVNFLQSWAYGEAKRNAEGWTPYRYLIKNPNSKFVGIVQILVRKISVLGGIARINRGPLFFEGVSQGERIAAIDMIVKECRAKKWRLLRIAPELDDCEKNRCAIKDIGFKNVASTPYGSGTLDLSIDESKLLMSLHPKWRNQMRRGLKLGASVEAIKVSEESILELISFYKAHQIYRGYKGLSEGLILAMSKQDQLGLHFNIFAAYTLQAPKEYVGYLLSIGSGDTCTYIIGSSTDSGRKLQANSVLLWHSIVVAKNLGYKFFDIGGLNGDTPKGIYEFKKGLNPTLYKLIGEWSKWIH